MQLGNQSAQLGQDGITQTESVIEAKLIALDYEDITKSDGFVSSDVAILKPNSGQFPALPLGTIEEAVVGSELQVIGYPSAASTALAMLDNTSTEPTFTKGLVSAIKLAKGNQKKLIQTDAIINHGNSGGPAILSSGKVVGIATYGVTVQDGSGSYNFLRDVQDLVDLAAKNNLIFDQGSLYRYWQDGLQNYYLGYYKYSTAIFESIKKTYPQHPLVDQYLKVSIEKTDTIEDKTPRLTVSTRQFLIKLSASLLVTSLIFILFFVILAKRQLKTIAQFSQTLPPAL